MHKNHTYKRPCSYVSGGLIRVHVTTPPPLPSPPLSPDRLPKALYLSLRGRALNVLPEHSPEAELCLSRAVKYDPQLIEAWIALGESYWKCGRVQQAHDCFTGSLSHRKTKEALRNLSIVQRQMGQGGPAGLHGSASGVVVERVERIGIVTR